MNDKIYDNLHYVLIGLTQKLIQKQKETKEIQEQINCINDAMEYFKQNNSIPEKIWSKEEIEDNLQEFAKNYVFEKISNDELENKIQEYMKNFVFEKVEGLKNSKNIKVDVTISKI